jgi:hypothetical protein
MDRLTLLRHLYSSLGCVADLAAETHHDEALNLVICFQQDVEGLIHFHEAMAASENVAVALSFRDAA